MTAEAPPYDPWALMQWRKNDQYHDGWFIGSEAKNGEHLRDASGWPYSIYRKAKQIGVSDCVLCHGIQSLADARSLLDLLNAQGGSGP